MITLKDLHLHSQRVSLAQARRELYLAVGEVIVSDKSSDKSDDNRRRNGSGNRPASRWCGAGLAQGKCG